jgi:hypothetical protein
VEISQEISSGLSQSGQSLYVFLFLLLLLWACANGAGCSEQAESDAASNFDKLANTLAGN